MEIKEINQVVRNALLEAVQEEEGPYNLYGRGHKDRLTLDKQLAAILKGLELPRVFISGYGPNYYYPTRVFKTAQKILAQKLKNCPIQLMVDNTSAWLKDLEWNAPE